MKTVLVIDDDAALVSVMAEVLTAHGYAVETAHSGEQGLALAQRIRPELIISDIRMPGRDGRMILRQLRDDPKLGSTQFVLMTGNVVDATARSEMARGADDFLVKPFHFDELLNCVEARMRRAEVQGKIEDRLLGSLRENLQSNLPHEFFTPLAGILGMAQLLRRQQKEMSVDERDEMLDEIERSGWRLHRTLSNFLVLFELETGSGSGVEANFLAPEEAIMVLRRQLELVVRRHAWTGEVWSEFKAPALVVEQEHFGKIVEELLDNACRYAPPRSRLGVTLGTDGCLAVEDEGRGLTDVELRELSAPPSSDRLDLSQRGPGLGLRVVKRLVGRYGGTIAARPRTGGGTRLEVRFQVAQDQPTAS